jgi:hypothetical protein
VAAIGLIASGFSFGFSGFAVRSAASQVEPPTYDEKASGSKLCAYGVFMVNPNCPNQQPGVTICTECQHPKRKANQCDQLVDIRFPGSSCVLRATALDRLCTDCTTSSTTP